MLNGFLGKNQCFSHFLQWFVGSDGHSGATSAATFSVAVAAALLLFFVTSEKRQRRCFFSEKKRQRFCAVFQANFLPLLLINFFQDFFRFKFLRVTVWGLCNVFFTLLLLLHYFSLVEQTMLPL